MTLQAVIARKLDI